MSEGGKDRNGGWKQVSIAKRWCEHGGGEYVVERRCDESTLMLWCRSGGSRRGIHYNAEM